jgi:hypothetical protein
MLCLAVVRLNYKIVIQNDNSHMCGNLSIDTRMREKLFNSNYYYKSIVREIQVTQNKLLICNVLF